MKNIHVILSGFCILFICSCSRHDDIETPEIVKVKKVVPYHTVLEEDTVGSIATKYKMSRSDLIKLNKLDPPYQLYNGQKLIIIPNIDDVKNEDNYNIQESQDIINDSSKSDLLNQNENKIIDEDNVTIDDIPQNIEQKEIKTVAESEYIWPIENAKKRISQKFGSNDVDGGIIINASVGTPVKSIANGVVMISGVPNGEAAAYGITVVIKHTSKKKMSIYSNLKETNVSVGQTVKKGDIIAKVGKSGTITKKPQLYFEINDLAGKGRKAMDPEKILPK